MKAWLTISAKDCLKAVFLGGIKVRLAYKGTEHSLNWSYGVEDDREKNKEAKPNEQE